MKKFAFLLVVALFASTVYGQGANPEHMIYAKMYEGCVDDEPSPIYGGSYSNYPVGMVDAKFPGGDVELSLFIHRNTERQEVYSGEVNEAGDSLLVTGEVLVQFVIDRCGKVGKVQVAQSLTDEQDAEAVRVIEAMPVFRAASIDGIRVKSAYLAPVKFGWEKMPPKKVEKSVEEIDWDSWDDEDWW